jgi:hypothetical protein
MQLHFCRKGRRIWVGSWIIVDGSWIIVHGLWILVDSPINSVKALKKMKAGKIEFTGLV